MEHEDQSKRKNCVISSLTDVVKECIMENAETKEISNVCETLKSREKEKNLPEHQEEKEDPIKPFTHFKNKCSFPKSQEEKRSSFKTFMPTKKIDSTSGEVVFTSYDLPKDPSSKISINTKNKANPTKDENKFKYKIEEMVTLRDFVLKCKKNNTGNETTEIPENLAKNILKEMIMFLFFFTGEDELAINPDKMRITAENGKLIGFYHIEALKFKTVGNDNEYLLPSTYKNITNNKNEIIEAQRVWAIGIILFEMLLGRRPFLATEVETMNQTEINAILLSQTHDILSQEVINLITSCLNINEGQVKIREMFKHDWFKE